jgi:hypothetical protein
MPITDAVHAPDVRVPTPVSEDPVTPDAIVVPVRADAGRAVAVMEELQLKPPLVVHSKAFVALEQDGMVRAVGVAALAVALPSTVLAPNVA